MGRHDFVLLSSRFACLSGRQVRDHSSESIPFSPRRTGMTESGSLIVRLSAYAHAGLPRCAGTIIDRCRFDPV
jgi:hypothetical protein